MMSHIERRALIAHLRANFRINWHGHHGIPHWARVRVNGLMLAKTTGANTHVVELFAFFHDSCRVNEYTDDGHGQRGALLLNSTLPSTFPVIGDPRLNEINGLRWFLC